MQTGHRSDTITVKFYGEYSRPPALAKLADAELHLVGDSSLAGLISFRTGCAATVGTRVPLASTAFIASSGTSGWRNLDSLSIPRHPLFPHTTACATRFAARSWARSTRRAPRE
jgi:hypothetical protein